MSGARLALEVLRDAAVHEHSDTATALRVVCDRALADPRLAQGVVCKGFACVSDSHLAQEFHYPACRCRFCGQPYSAHTQAATGSCTEPTKVPACPHCGKPL